MSAHLDLTIATEVIHEGEHGVVNSGINQHVMLDDENSSVKHFVHVVEFSSQFVYVSSLMELCWQVGSGVQWA